MFSDTLANLSNWYASITTTELVWLIIGFTAQTLFAMRFIVQWVTSEMSRRSVIPIAFWYFSICGGAMLFLYAIHRGDPVFILGQGTGLVIYARNLWLIHREKRENGAAVEGTAD